MRSLKKGIVSLALVGGVAAAPGAAQAVASFDLESRTSIGLGYGPRLVSTVDKAQAITEGRFLYVGDDGLLYQVSDDSKYLVNGHHVRNNTLLNGGGANGTSDITATYLPNAADCGFAPCSAPGALGVVTDTTTPPVSETITTGATGTVTGGTSGLVVSQRKIRLQGEAGPGESFEGGVSFGVVGGSLPVLKDALGEQMYPGGEENWAVIEVSNLGGTEQTVDFVALPNLVFDTSVDAPGEKAIGAANVLFGLSSSLGVTSIDTAFVNDDAPRPVDLTSFAPSTTCPVGGVPYTRPFPASGAAPNINHANDGCYNLKQFAEVWEADESGSTQSGGIPDFMWFSATLQPDSSGYIVFSLSNFGQLMSPVEDSTIPVPAALPLLGSAVAGLAVMRRRRKTA